MKFDIIVVINPYLPWKWNSKVDVISSLQTKASDQWFSRWCAAAGWRQEEARCQYQIYIKFNQIRTPDFRFKQKGTETNLLILTFNLTASSRCPDNGDDGVRVQTEICVSWDQQLRPVSYESPHWWKCHTCYPRTLNQWVHSHNFSE